MLLDKSIMFAHPLRVSVCSLSIALATGCGSSDDDGDLDADAGDIADGEDETETTHTETDGGSESDTAEELCGNGIVDPDEQCDNGAMNGGGLICTPECLINVCGDGYAFSDGLEECDDGNRNDTDECVEGCKAATCGDGFVQSGAEGCDDGNTADGDGCSSECTEQKVIGLASGWEHTCALLNNGKLRCWGNNTNGQLGYGNTEAIGDDEDPASAGDVDLGGIAIQITAGGAFTCALLDGGDVRCWGSNANGQLGYPGLGNVGDDESPASAGDVTLGGKAIQLGAGERHVCALLDTGKIRCWGQNADGQLGYGDTETIGDDENPSVAGDVIVGFGAIQVSAGDRHTCVVTNSNGGLRCWGRGFNGQLGYGNNQNVGDNEIPAIVGSVSTGGKVVQVSTDQARTCVRLETGDVRCWGAYSLGHPGVNDWIGDDELPTSLGVVDIGSPTTDLDSGNSHNCVVTIAGAVRCWGTGTWGQLGYGSQSTIGDDEDPAVAGDVQAGGTAVAVSTGGEHTCVLLSTGGVRCWGENEFGELGLGHTSNIGDDELPDSVEPVQVF